jgi:Tetratricopeptide repeat
LGEGPEWRVRNAFLGGVTSSAIWLLSVDTALAFEPGPGGATGSCRAALPPPAHRTDLMPSVTPGHPESAVEVDAAPQVLLPRTPPPAVRSGDEGSGGIELSAIAKTRVREAAARNASATELFDAGRYDEAVPLFEQALASCRSTLGGEHSDTLTVAGNLGVAHVAAGHRRKGIKLITSNLAARVRVLGDTHAATLTARNALSVAHRLTGDADTAVSLAKQVVLQRTRTLGRTHVDTLTSRMSLGWRWRQRETSPPPTGSSPPTVNDAEETLGPEHEHTVALVDCGEANGLLRRET